LNRRILFLAVLALAGCPKKTTTVQGPSAPEDDFKTVDTQTMPDGLILVQSDTNGDHQYDVFNYYQPLSNDRKQLVRKELDANRDGRVDTITYYGDDGDVSREEMDRDFDGQFDWTDRYQNDVRVMSEVDSNHDGKPDVFTYYEGNPPRVSSKESDTNGDTLIDLWEKFDDNGLVTRTGRDTDGDGKMDVRDE